jgi:hypothetical protein
MRVSSMRGMLRSEAIALVAVVLPGVWWAAAGSGWFGHTGQGRPRRTARPIGLGLIAASRSVTVGFLARHSYRPGGIGAAAALLGLVVVLRLNRPLAVHGLVPLPAYAAAVALIAVGSPAAVATVNARRSRDVAQGGYAAAWAGIVGGLVLFTVGVGSVWADSRLVEWTACVRRGWWRTPCATALIPSRSSSRGGRPGQPVQVRHREWRPPRSRARREWLPRPRSPAAATAGSSGGRSGPL